MLEPDPRTSRSWVTSRPSHTPSLFCFQTSAAWTPLLVPGLGSCPGSELPQPRPPSIAVLNYNVSVHQLTALPSPGNEECQAHQGSTSASPAQGLAQSGPSEEGSVNERRSESGWVHSTNI